MSSYKVFLVTALIFLTVFAISKIISLSAMTAAIYSVFSAFIFTYYLEPESYKLGPTIIVLIVVSVILFRHKENIKRLIRGEEKKASISKKENLTKESPVN